ncbi:hypothetical protein DRQ50_07715, partial [bacterium]
DGTSAGDDAPHLTVLDRYDDGTVVVTAGGDLAVVARRWGVMPLPPYIRREPGDERGAMDRLRYQTVFARPDAGGAGSVAAPTAGLHFSTEIMNRLADAGVETASVSLHVGPGTFQSPTGAQIAARRLHGEFFRLPAATMRALDRTRSRGGRVIAVGTTSLRVLETVSGLQLPPQGGEDHVLAGDDTVFTGRASWQTDAWEVAGITRLFIAPPDRVTAVDGLLTNFHLPGSSLLMLVAALAGDAAWRRIYRHAVAEKMRFYSYGDCMLVMPGIEERGPG